MNWQEKKTMFSSYLKRLYANFKVSGEESPETLRKKQLMHLSIGGCVALLGASYAIGLFDITTQPQEASKKKEEPTIMQRVADLSTPLSAVKDGDIWVSRVEKLVKSSQEELDKVKSENVFLDKKINTLMGILGTNPDSRAKAIQELQALENSAKKNGPITKPSATSSPQHFPAVGAEGTSPLGGNLSNPSYAATSSLKGISPNNTHVEDTRVQDPHVGDTRVRDKSVQGGRLGGSPAPKKRKLLHLSNANVSDHSNKSPATYLPAGTYFKVVTAMGVVVSTGTNSSSDPQPILLRIVDNGNLPGGLKGKVKDAVLIGTCYGSASAERAICRLKTLSWRDKSNRNIEKPIEGWIASEDGVQGIRAKIIDRSSEIAREAFGAGLLSAASNFFKMQSTSSVYPMTPFGQTNALSKGDALKGAVGGGFGSALDRLADFSIKRAESMSPVAYVASGRVLDAVLMRGVDLSPMVQDSLSLVNSSSETPHQPEPQGEN